MLKWIGLGFLFGKMYAESKQKQMTETEIIQKVGESAIAPIKKLAEIVPDEYKPDLDLDSLSEKYDELIKE